MNCPYCNLVLNPGLQSALSHNCCCEKPIALQFREGVPIGYLCYRKVGDKSFKIISSSYMNTTVVYSTKISSGIFLDNKVILKINSFIHPKQLDKKLKTILIFS